jgi:hypothetical protein
LTLARIIDQEKNAQRKRNNAMLCCASAFDMLID